MTKDNTTDVTTYEYETVDNRVEAPITMTKANSNNWGTIPGAYNSTLLDTMNIQYYNADFLSSKSIKELQAKVEAGGNADALFKEYMANAQDNGKTSSATLGVNRTMNPFFDFGKTTEAVMEYSPSIKNDPVYGYNADQVLPTINYEALNLWW